MRRLLYFATLLGSLTIPAIAHGISVDQPADGATVGRLVTLTGQATPHSGLAVLIDGQPYVPTAVRDQPGESSAGSTNESGNFSLLLDLTGDHVVNDLSGPTVRPSGVPAGPHRLVLREYFTDDREPAFTTIRLTVQAASVVADPEPSSVDLNTNSPTPAPVENQTTQQSQPVTIATALISTGLLVGMAGLTWWLARRP